MVDKLEDKGLLPDLGQKEHKGSSESKSYSNQTKDNDNSPIKVIVRKLIQFVADGTFLNNENLKASGATFLTVK